MRSAVSFPRLAVLSLLLTIGMLSLANHARAEESPLSAISWQLDSEYWVLEGYVSADDPAYIPIFLGGLECVSGLEISTDETGYFLMFFAPGNDFGIVSVTIFDGESPVTSYVTVD